MNAKNSLRDKLGAEGLRLKAEGKRLKGNNPLSPPLKRGIKGGCLQPIASRSELENFICAEFIEHDIMFLSELLCNMSINIECSSCTALLEGLMAVRRELIKEAKRRHL